MARITIKMLEDRLRQETFLREKAERLVAIMEPQMKLMSEGKTIGNLIPSTMIAMERISQAMTQMTLEMRYARESIEKERTYMGAALNHREREIQILYDRLAQYRKELEDANRK